jgi:RNA polymerase sigma factor (sigma-70 family)
LYWGGRGQKINVSSLSEDIDQTAEEDVSSFDETFEDITKNLSFLNKKILHMYYAQDLSMKEIAAQVDLSPTRVFQLLKFSLKKCRESYD